MRVIAYNVMPLWDEICADLYAQNSMLPLHYCGFLHTCLTVCGPEVALSKEALHISDTGSRGGEGVSGSIRIVLASFPGSLETLGPVMDYIFRLSFLLALSYLINT